MSLAVVGFALWLAAFGAPQNAGVGLEGTAWNAVELAGIAVTFAGAAADRQPHLVFGAGGQLSGADGCNRLTGTYTLMGESISFGPIAGTLMACPKTEEITRHFQAALKGTSHWRIENGRLLFYGATGKPLAVFERRAASPSGGVASLHGTRWQSVFAPFADAKP